MMASSKRRRINGIPSSLVHFQLGRPLALAARDHSRYSRNRDQIEIARADLAGRKEYL